MSKPPSRDVLGTTMNLGLLLEGQGKLQQAAALYLELLADQRRVLGAEHRDTLATAMQLAGAHLGRGGMRAIRVQDERGLWCGGNL